MKKKVIYWVMIVVFALIFLFSGAIVADYLLDSHKHKQMMEDIRDLHTVEPGYSRPTAPEEPEYTTSSAPGTSSKPPQTTVPTQPSWTTLPTQPGETTRPTIPNDPTQPTQPTEPAPTEPTPTEPRPTEPRPTEPQPTEPQPTVPTVPQPDFPTKPNTILPEMQAVYQLNNDVVGWVKIEDTNIDYPVLQRKSAPDYYISRNIYGNYDVRGSIYAEEHCDVFNPSDVVVLHGHHMADFTMFQNLYWFQYDYYFKSHRYVYFDTLYERRTYQVVLVFQTNGEPHATYPFFPFHTYNDFKDEEEFNYFMTSIRQLAVQKSNVKVNYGDKLLLLSTCDYSPYPNGRLVVVAKLIG